MSVKIPAEVWTVTAYTTTEDSECRPHGNDQSIGAFLRPILCSYLYMFCRTLGIFD
jgi:hypothetical protein